MNSSTNNPYVELRELINKESNYWQTQKSKKHSQKILIATSLGGYNHANILESTLAAALTLRNASVEILLCDKILPACQMTKIGKISPEELTKSGQLKICNSCLKQGNEIFQPLDLPIHYFSKYLTGSQNVFARKITQSLPLKSISSYKLGGIAVGEHAYAGTLRYFATGDLENEPLGESVLRRYLEGAIRTLFVSKSLFENIRYDVVCFHHGIYVPQGIIGEVARKMKIRVVNWNPAYRRHSFIFSHNNSYHYTMIMESEKIWKNLKLNANKKKQIIDYLKSRENGINDWIWFHDKKNNFDNIPHLRINKIDFEKPLIGLLTNVTWDARLHYKSVAFKDMFSWIKSTIRFFAKRPDLQLIIRVHPAEITGLIPSRQPIAQKIKKVFPELPDNIFLIDADSKLSTYEIMKKCNAVIIYNTKTGIELVARGLPVIVAGEAWIRNKGFSFDVTNAQEYIEILDKLPFKKKLDKKRKEKALKYAFHFFFRRMITLPFIESPEKFKFKLHLSSLYQLLPGNFEGLDVICSGILNNKPFIINT